MTRPLTAPRSPQGDKITPHKDGTFTSHAVERVGTTRYHTLFVWHDGLGRYGIAGSIAWKTVPKESHSPTFCLSATRYRDGDLRFEFPEKTAEAHRAATAKLRRWIAAPDDTTPYGETA